MTFIVSTPFNFIYHALISIWCGMELTQIIAWINYSSNFESSMTIIYYINGRCIIYQTKSGQTKSDLV